MVLERAASHAVALRGAALLPAREAALLGEELGAARRAQWLGPARLGLGRRLCAAAPGSAAARQLAFLSGADCADDGRWLRREHLPRLPPFAALRRCVVARGGGCSFDALLEGLGGGGLEDGGGGGGDFGFAADAAGGLGTVAGVRLLPPLPRGHVLFAEGSPAIGVFVVLSGCVTATIADDGGEAISRASAGDRDQGEGGMTTGPARTFALPEYLLRQGHHGGRMGEAGSCNVEELDGVGGSAALHWETVAAREAWRRRRSSADCLLASRSIRVRPLLLLLLPLL